MVSIDLVDDLFSSPIILYWDKMKPMIEGMRKYFYRPQLGEWFEYLYNEMRKREHQEKDSG